MRLTVVAPLPGSPAEKAGLQPGDYITEINGQWIATYDPALRGLQDSSSALKNDPVAFNKLATDHREEGDRRRWR